MNPDRDRVLELIAEGHFNRVVDHRYIVINNPEYNPIDGSDPFIVYDTKANDFSD